MKYDNKKLIGIDDNTPNKKLKEKLKGRYLCKDKGKVVRKDM